MAQLKIPRSLGIHDGPFHADEVTAAALLSLFSLVDRDKILRTRDKEKLSHCEYVCDVGGIYDTQKKLFDHHQADYQGDLSSAGMALLYLKEQGVISSEEFDVFNHALILGVDAHDNGRANQEKGVCTFSHAIANFSPISHEASSEELNEAFSQAFAFAYGHLERLHARYRYHKECRQIVADTMKKYKQCLMFEQSLPWLESFFALGGKEHSALFVIMPAGEHWKLRGIPPDYERRMQVRVPLPSEWAGLLEEDLKKVAGIPGAIFCHKGRFTSVWETKEDAIAALKYVLKKNEIHDEDNL